MFHFYTIQKCLKRQEWIIYCFLRKKQTYFIIFKSLVLFWNLILKSFVSSTVFPLHMYIITVRNYNNSSSFHRFHNFSNFVYKNIFHFSFVFYRITQWWYEYWPRILVRSRFTDNDRKSRISSVWSS